MAKRLRPQDAHAVDLLLNKAGAKTMREESNQYAAPSNDAERASVKRVEALLTLIQQWPAEEPPAGLVERTIARIDAAVPQSHAGEDHQQAASRLHDPNGPVS
jgi:hypothetical protein